MQKKLIRKALWLLPCPLALLLYHLAFSNPAAVETMYSRGIYPVLSAIVGFLTNIFPFSVAEFGLYGFIIFCIVLLVRIVLAFFHQRGQRLSAFASRGLTLLLAISSLVTAFVFFWGLNYARMPLAASLHLDTSPATAAELRDACEKLILRANALRARVSEDESGVFSPAHTSGEILTSVPEIYAENGEPLFQQGARSRVKGVATPNLLSSIVTSGIFCPFTYEPNVNMQMPALYLPATAAHEFAHLKGFAREDEANFIAWYVCRDSENMDFAYSAAALALTHSMNALYDADPELHRELYYTIHEGILRDWAHDGAYWRPFRTELTEQTNQVYSNYLKANGVSDGRKSYGRMVDLIIAMDRAGKL